MHPRALAATLCLAATVALTGCSTQPSGPAAEDLVDNSKPYSLTQTVQNNSTMDLTVQSVRADNGGTVTPGWPAVIRAGTSGTFAATNTGNGVQVWITLLGTGGQVVTVDTDVHRVDTNTGTATLSGSQTLLNMGAISIGGGDNPSASFTIDPCAPNARCIPVAPFDVGP
ncbi:hypothetical protein [Actinomycetospora soli]|uniref:hypothetical protein n=1 Tax=Actinomycetospora soli TaxID=2893887 RepID=UPI001E643F93|nr:hypothetical protein [Actinomycetospora soli]MCD2189389.1 hypothetical protein [Actinomycetospora soli]